MRHAFICDDTRTYKPILPNKPAHALVFLHEKLENDYEVRVVNMRSIPYGYKEA